MHHRILSVTLNISDFLVVWILVSLVKGLTSVLAQRKALAGHCCTRKMDSFVLIKKISLWWYKAYDDGSEPLIQGTMFYTWTGCPDKRNQVLPFLFLHCWQPCKDPIRLKSWMVWFVYCSAREFVNIIRMIRKKFYHLKEEIPALYLPLV